METVQIQLAAIVPDRDGRRSRAQRADRLVGLELGDALTSEKTAAPFQPSRKSRETAAKSGEAKMS